MPLFAHAHYPNAITTLVHRVLFLHSRNCIAGVIFQLSVVEIKLVETPVVGLVGKSVARSAESSAVGLIERTVGLEVGREHNPSISALSSFNRTTQPE